MPPRPQPLPLLRPKQSPPPAEAPETLDEVTVRARNRLERLKDVPISVSVVAGVELDRLQARDLSSITQRAANISWNQGNARTSALSVRGLGKQAQTDAQDPSVGITVDGVPYAYNPLSSFDFYDVDGIEVLRGPQATLYGKNASVGAISINTRRPSFTPDASYSLALGQNRRIIASAAAGGAVVDNVLAWRAAFSVDKGQGSYPNQSDHKQSSEELRITSERGGAVDYQAGLLLLNSSNNYSSRTGFGSDAGAWFASSAQYGRLDVDGNGRYLLQNALSRLEHNTPQHIENQSRAIHGQANWHISAPFTITGGLRLTSEKRNNWSSKLIATEGLGAELDPVAVNGVRLGGFASNSVGVLGLNTPAQLALANAAAIKYFGAAGYASLSAAQQRQVADAKAIRQTNLGVLWNPVTAEQFKQVQPTALVSPSYKFNEDVTGYVSLQYGEKAGISQIVNGVSNLIRPEKSAAYETGVKSTLFGKTLTLNADLFLSHVKDYQQAVQVYDDYTTRLNNNGQNYYTAATGNVAKVRAYGLEIDGVYSGFQYTSLRFSGAYNNATYQDFKNSSNPVEVLSSTPYRDVSGQNLPGAAKVTFNVGAEYRRPIPGWTNKLFHTSFNTAYTGKYNSDIALSSYAWVPSYSITDFSIGFGTTDQKFDVNLLVKNLFDDRTSQVATWNSTVPAAPRWIGIVFSGKL